MSGVQNTYYRVSLSIVFFGGRSISLMQVFSETYDLSLVWDNLPSSKIIFVKKNKNSSHPNNHAIIRNFGKASRHLLLFLFFWYILILLFFSKKKKEKKIDVIIRWAKQQIQNMPPVHKLKGIIKKNVL